MESLPKQFVAAMRTLFDIMDEKQTGYVQLGDIGRRWRDDRTKGLPPGVLESLQKVASHDGLLTFDRFCTGLKICLLRNQVGRPDNMRAHDDVEMEDKHSNITDPQQRPPSAPLLDLMDSHSRDRNWNDIKVTDKLSRHRVTKDMHDQRLSVMPPQPKQEALTAYGNGPPKPPRLEKLQLDRKDMQRPGCKPDEAAFDKLRIDDSGDDILRSIDDYSRGHADGHSTESSQMQVARRNRRREPRRHTLHNGVDYNLLKRMKQIEQEKDILLQGLSSVEEAREWYLKQLGEVQDKIRYAGRMGAYVEPWTEGQQERLELLRARVVELSRQLGALAAGWRRGPLSLHMNLALPAPPAARADPRAGPRADPHSAALRTHNRMLIEEVNKKNERITILEREKSSLIRELLLYRNRSKMIEKLS